MKRLILVLAIVALSSTIAFGGTKATVNNTVHDITKHTGASEKTAISCTNCHTPHVSQADTPLFWARSFATTATFNAYTGTTTVTEVAITKPTVQADPMWFSYLCMSCHDSAGSVSDGFLGSAGLTFHEVNGVGTTKFGSTTLQTDHPVNFAYGDAPAAEYNAAVSGKIGGLPVYSGNSKTDTVQCATCHDVHATNYAFVVATPPAPSARTMFLRAPVAANVCLECHK